MVEPWAPELRLEEAPSGCRLVLVGFTAGVGPTLQDAADDLIIQLTRLVVTLRTARFRRLPFEERALDGRMLAFLWDVTDRVARGEDIRGRALGFSTAPDPAA